MVFKEFLRIRVHSRIEGSTETTGKYDPAMVHVTVIYMVRHHIYSRPTVEK